MTGAKIASIKASKQLCLVCISVLLLVGLCFSQPKVGLLPSSGPPTTNVLVSGSGFPAFAAIDIYFDTTDLALAVTGSTGSFSKIAIQVPASALPGTHMVTAVARSNGAEGFSGANQLVAVSLHPPPQGP
jgi:hypothetical protein